MFVENSKKFKWRLGNLKRYFQFGPILKQMNQITVPRSFNFFIYSESLRDSFFFKFKDGTKLKIPSEINQPLPFSSFWFEKVSKEMYTYFGLSDATVVLLFRLIRTFSRSENLPCSAGK